MSGATTAPAFAASASARLRSASQAATISNAADSMKEKAAELGGAVATQAEKAVATVKIGPVKAKFKGKVTLSDLDPPHGYKISGQGDGGVAGFAKGGATVKLTPKDGGTLLSYDVDAQIGGKLAQLGQRLVNGAAKKVADDFFANFAAAVNPKAA